MESFSFSLRTRCVAANCRTFFFFRGRHRGNPSSYPIQSQAAQKRRDGREPETGVRFKDFLGHRTGRSSLIMSDIPCDLVFCSSRTRFPGSQANEGRHATGTMATVLRDPETNGNRSPRWQVAMDRKESENKSK